jgi:diadenylate cyclase
MTELLQKTDWFLPLLDIVLVAVVIYRLMLLLKESTAIKVLVATPLLLIGSLLAQFAGLQTLRWLMNNFFGSIFIILAIIFQHDIRRAILSFNRSRLAKGIDAEEEDANAVVEELVVSAESLASRRIGALIVVEREMPLASFMAVGTEIDAKVTSELITSIFLPYSPIHDGAVIIQRGKLTKAGCFLPLTQNPEVAKELGTRHRAAIGLTELADALVIVVSEETGAVSVVVGGKINRELEVGALRKLLRRLLEPRWLQ